MRSQKICARAVIVLLIALFIAPCVSDAQIKEEDTAIVTTLNQIKAIVSTRASKDYVKEIVADVRKLRPNAFRYDSYVNNEAGWSVFDNQGRTVIRVVCNFTNNLAVSGRLVGISVYSANSDELHRFYRGSLDRNFQKVSRDMYSLGDECTARLILYHGDSGIDNSIISVGCR